MEIKTPKRVFPVLVRRTVPLSREVGASGWYAQATICSWMASQFARVQELDPPKDDKSPPRLLHFSGNAPHRTCRLCDTHREPVLMVSPFSRLHAHLGMVVGLFLFFPVEEPSFETCEICGAVTEYTGFLSTVVFIFCERAALRRKNNKDSRSICDENCNRWS